MSDVLLDKRSFEAAGGRWKEGAIQWVDYWGDGDREDPSIEKPWADFTLMAWSEEVGDYKGVTEEDLRRLGWGKCNRGGE